MLNSINLSLSIDQIIIAAILGLVLTFILQHIIKIKNMLKDVSVDFGYNSEDIKKIIDKCYVMFPTEKLLFKGETYLRGAKIKVKTLQNKIFEGELIGVNSKNMFCIMTNKYIMAHEITNIEEISLIK